MSRVRVSSVTVGQLAVNCWFLINEDTKEALVFDPGDQADKIAQYASEQGVKITAALLTHGHIDHMGGADALRNLQVQKYMHFGRKKIFFWMPSRICRSTLPEKW